MFDLKHMHAVSTKALLASALVFGCAGADGSGSEQTTEESSSGALSIAQCRVAGDCVAPAAPCRQCAEGGFSCPQAVCLNGQCSVKWPACPGLTRCGGFAGIPCPSGLTCVDDPRDDCSPCRGGADCGGICVETTCKQPTCDASLICAQVLTCVGGQLYPTACGPKNCDRPIGPCDRATQAE